MPSGPKAFVNIIVFDKNYKLLDASWEAVDPAANQVGASPVVAHDYLMKEYTVREEGYVFMYVSNENATLVDVYFDDVVMTLTKGNVIQYNEYYPFGLQTANSWTRENTTGNNFLGNGGTELNQTSQLYDLDYRNYDPVLGRMNGVDPMATKYASVSPYNFAFNDPVTLNDPSGADPYTINYSAVVNSYYTGYTYDDKVDYHGTAVWYDAMGWRNEVPGAMGFYNTAMGYGSSGFHSGFNSWVNSIVHAQAIVNGIADALNNTENGGVVSTSSGSVMPFSIASSEHGITYRAVDKFGNVIGTISFGYDGKFNSKETQKIKLTGYEILWYGKENESQINGYKINFDISETTSNESTFTAYIGKGSIIGNYGGNAFKNDQGKFASKHPAYRPNFTTTDKTAVKVNYKREDGALKFINYEHVSKTFTLSNKSIDLITEKIKQLDAQHVTIWDQLKRTNQELGSPISPFPLKRIKRRE